MHLHVHISLGNKNEIYFYFYFGDKIIYHINNRISWMSVVIVFELETVLFLRRLQFGIACLVLFVYLCFDHCFKILFYYIECYCSYNIILVFTKLQKTIKRKLKQWWMANNSNNIKKATVTGTSHLNQENAKIPRHMTLEFHVLA